MQDLNDKVTGDTLTAAEWNQPASELQNIITPAGIVLSSGDLAQAAKALTYWVASAPFFTASTDAGGNITLTPVGVHGTLQALANGIRIRFLVTSAIATASAGITITVGAFTKTFTRRDGSALTAGTYGLGTFTEVQYNSTDDRWESTESLPGVNGSSVVKANSGDIEEPGALTNRGGRVATIDVIKFQRKRKVVTTDFTVPGTTTGGGSPINTNITPLSVTLNKDSAGVRFYKVTYRIHTDAIAGTIADDLVLTLDFGSIAGGRQYSVKTECTFAGGAGTSVTPDVRMVSVTPGAGPLILSIFTTDVVSDNRYWNIEIITPATGNTLSLYIENGAAADGTVVAGSSVVAELIG